MVERLTGRKVIGIKQATKSLKNHIGQTLYVAKDSDKNLTNPVISLAEETSVEIKYVDTMKELGKLCGIDVGAAVALIIK
ncbi:ribosomal L7Ae/L30e/S12e/Gadd45 family protein [Clostridium sp. 19966]|uniref:ribosomal L7Ae/L30e/S12e/Gadd45 family protein n=1 Tax=Clostridium sp. 19966 TaxID=2768166 RepID=UPI0028DFB19A|nr:ribosomal L7Ae/L30e/S12e/Gadd45 family protein [Clostridium sp. 19966]MDT8715809.1 ribosomal L7Ae/L30e/S12e/Gadd45 family protein [Clostridium sp. 19966]